MARDDYGNRDRDDRDDRLSRGDDRGRDRGRERDPYGGEMFGMERDAMGGRGDRYASRGDERDVGYGGDRDRSDRERLDRERLDRERLDRESRGTAYQGGLENSGRAGIGGGMGVEGGGRYAGRPEDDARAMRYDREDYEGGRDRTGSRDSMRGGNRDLGGSWDGDRSRGFRGGLDRDDARVDRLGRDAYARDEYRRGGMARGNESEYGMGYAHDYGRQGDYGREGGGMAGRPGGYDRDRDYDRDRERHDESRGLSGAGYGASHGGVVDRNPGQGFGAFGFNNANAEGERMREGRGRDAGMQRGMHAGRGPRNYQRSDERIRDDVCERLTRHPEVDPSDVDIDVREGVVTLSGKVDDKHTKRLAEDLAEEVMGVREVRNDLKTSKGGFFSQLFGGEDAEVTREESSRSDREVARGASRERGATASGGMAAGGAGTTGAAPTEGTRARGGSTGGATAGDADATRRGRST